MKIFHLENMTTQRTPRASAGKVLVTAVSIENKIIGGRMQEQSSPLRDHPAYKMLEAYVLAHPTAPTLENPPFSLTLPESPAAHTPTDPEPLVAGGTMRVRARPVDKTMPRGR